MPVPAGGDPGGGAVGDPYATLDQVKTYMGIDLDDTKDDEGLLTALASVSVEIEDVCHRQFNRDEVASTRTFPVLGSGLVLVDDFYTLTDLATTIDGTAWAQTDYRLFPTNGLVHGRPWPYNRLEARSGWPWPSRCTDVSVTARWGWPAVPAPVHEACKIATAETAGLKDARFGVAGFGQYGDIRVRSNPMVMAKLRPYQLDPVMVA